MAVVTSTSDAVLPLALKFTNVQGPHGPGGPRQPLAHASCPSIDARNVPADVGPTNPRERLPRQTQRRDAPVTFLVAALVPGDALHFTLGPPRRAQVVEAELAVLRADDDLCGSCVASTAWNLHAIEQVQSRASMARGA